MSSRWTGELPPEPSRDTAAHRELERMLEDEWRTARRLYPHLADSDVTPLGSREEPSTGGAYLSSVPPAERTDAAASPEDHS